MTAAEWIAQAHAVTDGASSGPWEYWPETDEILARDGGIAAMTWPGRDAPNAAFIAASRTMLPAAVAALEAVLAACDEYQDTIGVIFADDIRAVLTAALDPS